MNYSFSEEAYFGINHPFPSEMISVVSELREVLRELLGAEWSDVSKRTIIIKKEMLKSKDISKLVEVSDRLGSCISRHTNVEKCYIGYFNDINANTMPMYYDPKIMVYPESIISTVNGKPRLNANNLRNIGDILKQLSTFDDITMNSSDGWKFKESKGKVMLINIGIPLIIDQQYEASVEDICCTIFHEIGHNFQQALRGTNQSIIMGIHKFCIREMFDSLMFGDGTMYGAFKKLLKDTLKFQFSESDRVYLLKMVVSSAVSFKKNENGEWVLVTREDIGEEERSNYEKVMEKARKARMLTTLSFISKLFYVTFLSINKVFELIGAPLRSITLKTIEYNLMKPYSEVIKSNKIFEQFADAFAVSYGFGKNNASFYINYRKLVQSMKPVSHLDILNNIPYLSTMAAMNSFKVRAMGTITAGYDEDYVRVANAYKVLEYEILNNKDLTSQQRREIVEQMEQVKEGYETLKQLEADTYTSNKRLSSWIMKNLRNRTIETITKNNGLEEGVLKVIEEFEKTGSIAKPTVDFELDKRIEEFEKSGAKDIDTAIGKTIGKYNLMELGQLKFY